MSKTMTNWPITEGERQIIKKPTRLLQFFSLSWKFLLLLQFSSEASLNQPQNKIPVTSCINRASQHLHNSSSTPYIIQGRPGWLQFYPICAMRGILIMNTGSRMKQVGL